jgi:hypothetical protein
MASFQEEQERLRKATEQMSRGGGALTNPMPDIASQNINPEHMVSPASASGETAPIGAAPASNGANGTQAGAGDLTQDRGSGTDRLKETGPIEGLNIATTSASAISNTGKTAGNKEAAAQKKEMNESMAAQGMSPEAGLKQLIDAEVKELNRLRKANDITPKQHKELKNRWKNIYNIIPKEDMGLFLMDFGFRMMAAGETMGSAAAIGTAGQGALQGQQMRRQAEEDLTIEDRKQATQTGLRQHTALSRPTTLAAGSGYMTYVPGQGWKRIKDPDTGENVIPSSMLGKPPVDKWKIDWYVKHLGLTEAEAGRRVLGGVTPEQAMQDGQAAWARFENSSGGTITIRGESYRKRQLPAGAKKMFLDEFLSQFGFSPDAAQGGALGGATGALNGGGSGRPAGMDDYIN